MTEHRQRPPARQVAPAVALAVAALAALVASTPVHADNWPQFRGPGSRGLSSETGLPLKWTATSNVAWKAPLPGPGHSSPIVWGNRIFLTAFRPAPGGTGGVFRSLMGLIARGVSVSGQLFVLCLDRATGKALWEREVPLEVIEEVHPTNSPASPTPVTDGQRVYVYFGSYGLLAYDFDGRKIWERRLGPFPNEWGSASSPILYGNMLILNCDTDAEDFLLAVDKATGKTIWQTPRNATRAWPVPVIWNAGGRDQIVVSGSERVTAYDPSNGREIWTVDGLSTWVSPTPVAAHGLLFVAANGPGGNIIMAIRPGGRGNITSTHVAWRHERAAPYIPSPIVVGDYLFVVKDGGIMTCLNARTGELAWQQRLPARGSYYASPVAAEGRLYVISEDGEVTVVAAKPTFEVIATSSMGERTMASPALSSGQIFIRTDNALWAIGKASS